MHQKNKSARNPKSSILGSCNALDEFHILDVNGNVLG